MLPVSLDCPFLCTQCCQFLWIVHSCVHNVASFSGLSILVCTMLQVSLDCPFLCTPCCQFLWIVHSWLSLHFSLTFILNGDFLLSNISSPWTRWRTDVTYVLLSSVWIRWRTNASCVLLSYAWTRWRTDGPNVLLPSAWTRWRTYVTYVLITSVWNRWRTDGSNVLLSSAWTCWRTYVRQQVHADDRSTFTFTYVICMNSLPERRVICTSSHLFLNCCAHWSTHNIDIFFWNYCLILMGIQYN
jgi:hypothetical protein